MRHRISSPEFQIYMKQELGGCESGLLRLSLRRYAVGEFAYPLHPQARCSFGRPHTSSRTTKTSQGSRPRQVSGRPW